MQHIAKGRAELSHMAITCARRAAFRGALIGVAHPGAGGTIPSERALLLVIGEPGRRLGAPGRAIWAETGQSVRIAGAEWQVCAVTSSPDRHHRCVELARIT